MARNKTIINCIPDDLSVPMLHPALRHYFTYKFYKTALRLRAKVNAALEPHDIGGPELGIIRVLEIEGAMSQVDLGRSLGIDKATMVKMLDHLEHKKFIRRVAVEGDRRVKHIRVTPEGKAMFKLGGRIREKVEKEFFAPISLADRKRLEEILDKLIG